MKTILFSILGLSIAIVSCAGPKGKKVALQHSEEIAKGFEKEERIESLKRHNRW